MPAFSKRAQRAAVQTSVARGVLAEDVEETRPRTRTRKSIGTSRSRQAQSISASCWRSLARVVPQEDWDSL